MPLLIFCFPSCLEAMSRRNVQFAQAKKENVLNLRFPFFILYCSWRQFELRPHRGFPYIFLIPSFSRHPSPPFLAWGQKRRNIGWNTRRKEGGRELFMNNFVSTRPSPSLPICLRIYISKIYFPFSHYSGGGGSLQLVACIHCRPQRGYWNF